MTVTPSLPIAPSRRTRSSRKPCRRCAASTIGICPTSSPARITVPPGARCAARSARHQAQRAGQDIGQHQIELLRARALPAIAQPRRHAAAQAVQRGVLRRDAHGPRIVVHRQHAPAQQARRRHRQDARSAAHVDDPRGRRCATASSARRQPRVLPCSPEPNARPASTVSVWRPWPARAIQMRAAYGEALADRLFRERRIHARQPALGLGRLALQRPPPRR